MSHDHPQPTLPDVPVTTSDIATLFSQYAAVVADLVLRARPTFTIGIYGPHGSGKSSFLNLVHRLVDQRVDQSSPHLGREEITAPVVQVHLDPAEYPVDTIAELLTQDLGDSLLRYLTVWQQMRLISRKNWRFYYQRIRPQLLPILILVLATELLAIYLMVRQQVRLDLSLLLLLVGSGAFVSAIGTLRSVLRVVQTVLETEANRAPGASSGRVDSKPQSLRILDGLGQVFRDEKILLTLDLSNATDRALEVLEFVKYLSRLHVFVIVIAMDADAIAAAAASQQKADIGLGQDAHAFGQAYLESIIQFPLHVPRLDQADVRAFLGHLTGVGGLEGGTFTADEQNAFVALAPFLEPNPREIKRLINSFYASRTLASQRAYPVDPAKLARWLLIGKRWPQFLAAILDTLDHSEGLTFRPDTPLNAVLKATIQRQAEDASAQYLETIAELLGLQPPITVSDVTEFLRLTTLLMPQVQSRKDILNSALLQATTTAVQSKAALDTESASSGAA